MYRDLTGHWKEEFIEHREFMEAFGIIRRGCKVVLGMYRPWRGFVINFMRIPLSLKSYGLIQVLDKAKNCYIFRE
ncbi:MAG: hypothetical protein N2327_00290 [Caldimicrobium sp.]|nr:hypothetical protein [Caldimicrobium sp.]MCX7872866.1 hypothetical protein [Caldimicrobium sp.]